MRKVSLSVCVAFAFFVASAVAQMAPGGSQGTQNSSPSQTQSGTGQMGSDQGTSQSTQSQSNGERTLKGCVRSEGASYVLETKKGREVALAGQDLSAHVGHEVAVKGTFGSGNGMSSTSSGNAGGAEKTFNVSSVKHISDTCKGAKTSSGSMGNSGSSVGSASGHSTSGDMGATPQGGNSTPSGTGNNSQPQGSQPPQ